MKRGVVAVMLLWLLWPLAGAAQELMPSAWQYYIEQLSDEGDDETVEEMLELYESLHDSPVNLNDTSDLLSAIPFVSDLQRERLRAYIMLSGELLSIEELYVINGFDSLTVELLRPIVKAEPLEVFASDYMERTADPREEQSGDGHWRHCGTGARLSRQHL